MTVLQKAPRSPRPTRKNCPAAEFVPSDRSLLLSPNMADLKPANRTRAEHLLAAMLSALREQDVPSFNEAREELCGWLKRHGQPITQWNPLILLLPSTDTLRGASLANINLSMISLRCREGQVSLEETNLQGASLLCADLSEANLSQADFSGADARFADFCDAHMERTLLVGADLSHAKLSGARLTLANLYCARLTNAILKHARMEEVNLRKADLRNADLYQVSLCKARLQQADLREANLFMADLACAKLRHADLRKAHLVRVNLNQAKLNSSKLQEANLTSANLGQANLQRCRLQGATLNRALTGLAQMQNADLQGASLNECVELDQADLAGALYDRHTVFPKFFKPQRHRLVKKQAKGLNHLLEKLSRLFAGLPEPLAH